MPEEIERPTPRTVVLADLVPDLVADVEAAREAVKCGMPRGPVTGLAELDRIMGGFFAPGLHVVQAAPGAGKTAFALQVASRCCFSALFVSVEMGLLELFRRLVAREANTFLGKIKSGELEPEVVQRLALQTVENLPNLALMDTTNAYASPALIQDTAAALREQAGSPHVLIVIDSLHAWAKGRRWAEQGLASLTEYELINDGLEQVAAVSMALCCLILLVSHRNRAGNKGGDPLHAAKGSGDVEYAAESILDLTPKSATGATASGEHEVQAMLSKNRHGVVGASVTLRFNGALQEFRQ